MTNGTENIKSIFTDNEGKYTQRTVHKNIPEDAVDRIADYLVEKLGCPESREYYCKIARKINHTTLERLADTAVEVGRHKGKLFTHLAQKELRRLGVIRDE